MNKTRLAPR